MFEKIKDFVKPMKGDVIGYGYKLAKADSKIFEYDIYEVLNDPDEPFRFSYKLGKFDRYYSNETEEKLKAQGMKPLAIWLNELQFSESGPRTHQMKRLQLFFNELSLHQLKLIELIVREFIFEPSPIDHIAAITTFLMEVEVNGHAIEQTELYQKIKKNRN